MSKKEKNPSQNQSYTSSEGDDIKVFVRVRPSEAKDNDMDLGQCLEVRPPDTIIMHSKPEPKVFTFDHVAQGTITQEAVFTAVGKRIIESCVGGYNGTIFAYGQTGSGKTFTMLGPSEDGDNFHHELRGVIPRTFEYLFSLVNRERVKHGDRFEFLCRCSFLEIYNEQIFDLLDQASMGLHLRENMKKGVFVDGLVERTVASPSEAYNVLTAGWLNRRVAATSMNRESSRSHAVFTVSIETKEKKAGVSNIRVSQLHLVDLAGSERQKSTQTVGMRLKEAGSINRSLSILGNVIMALVDIAHGKQRHVPYRDSKLTFLLRDSLGGNAKTYIIANVHPDAKCFGETLSTLKFARRAKMIKNRAVVNEDTQGNIMDLQAEIRRLREALAQKGPGPELQSQPGVIQSSAESVQSTSTHSSGDGNGKWRRYFLEAMILRETVESQKKDLQDRAKGFEDLLRKRDQALQSNKMILKFRENTITDLMKSKGKDTPPDDKDRINENLKKEIDQLREQLEHNPYVMRYVVENQSLRAQNKKLRAMEAVRAGEVVMATKAQELVKLFLEQREGLSKTGRLSVTPSSTPADGETVPSSTVNILKSQIKKLQEDMENTKQEHAEKQEIDRKKRLELEAELASFKKTNRELEKNLEGILVKSRLERDAMNDMHMQTIKTITTPKKVKYNLRSRLVLRAAGETPGGSSIPDIGSPLRSSSASRHPSEEAVTPGSCAEDELGIVDEDMPEQMVEQCNEALTVEIKKLQEKSGNLQKQLEEHETQKHKMVQNITKLEHQLEQLNQLHSSESKAWAERENEMTNFVSNLTTELDTLKKDYALARSEAEDFRIMLNSADKEYKEERQRKGLEEEQWTKTKATLDAQVVRLENELCEKARKIEGLSEDKEQMQDAYNTLQAEYEFQQQREAEIENRLKGKNIEITQLQEEIQTNLEKLESQYEKTNRLTAELRQQGDSSKQELLAAHDEIDGLREERSGLYQRLDEEAQKLVDSKKAMEAVATELAASKRTEEQQKEALSSLMSTLQEHKSIVKERDEEVSSLRIKLEDSTGQIGMLEGALDEQKSQVAVLEMQVAAAEEKVLSQARDYQQQIEQLREEAMDHNRQQSELLKELEKLSNNTSQLHEQLKNKEEELSRKEEELARKDAEYNAKVAALESQVEEMKNNLSTVVVEMEDDSGEPGAKRRRTAETQVLELESLRESKARFDDLFREFEQLKEQKNEEIRLLKMKADELEEVSVAKEILAAQHQTLKYEMEALTNELKEREVDLQNEVEVLRKDREVQSTALKSTIKEKEDALRNLDSLQSQLEQKTANEEIMQENVDQLMEELDRTSALESAHFREKEDIKSKLEEEQEEKSKVLKEMGNLRERIDELSSENAKLVSHNNHKQKLHYHMQVKMENATLKEQMAKSRKEMDAMRRELDGLRKRDGHHDSRSNGHGKTLAQKQDTSFKENISDPEMSS